MPFLSATKCEGDLYDMKVIVEENASLPRETPPVRAPLAPLRTYLGADTALQVEHR